MIFYSDDTSRASEVRHALEPWAYSKGIVAAVENDCLALGLNVLPGEEKDLVVRSIVESIRKVSAALNDIPSPLQVAKTTDE